MEKDAGSGSTFVNDDQVKSVNPVESDNFANDDLVKSIHSDHFAKSTQSEKSDPFAKSIHSEKVKAF